MGKWNKSYSCLLEYQHYSYLKFSVLATAHVTALIVDGYGVYPIL